MRIILAVTALSASAMLHAGSVAAQTGTLSVELNKAETTETGCLVTYVATNGTGTDLDSASYEVAVFDSDGEVEGLLLLQFGPLADGRTKVFPFGMSETGCETISRVLVNDVDQCTASDGSEVDCLSLLETSSRAPIAFGL
jgi:hypothetical protein